MLMPETQRLTLLEDNKQHLTLLWWKLVPSAIFFVASLVAVFASWYIKNGVTLLGAIGLLIFGVLCWRTISEIRWTYNAIRELEGPGYLRQQRQTSFDQYDDGHDDEG